MLNPRRSASQDRRGRSAMTTRGNKNWPLLVTGAYSCIAFENITKVNAGHMCTSAVRFLDYRDFPNANQGNREGLDPFEASSKKSIEPAHAGVHVRPMARQGAQVAKLRDEFVKLREIGSRDWFTAH